MELRREVLAVFCVVSLLLSDPQLTHAYALQHNPPDSGWAVSLSPTINPFLELSDRDEIHLVYELNGGINSSENPETLPRTMLPFTLELPMREGYNFAGWYTDSSYTHKITVLDDANAANMVLFAKWTKIIDSHYNVEMYSYSSGNILSGNLMELKECSYTFLDDVAIPGMPSTRERDYLNRIISSEAQCLQGLCITPEYILMTSYAEDDKIPGSLMVFNRESGTFLVTLGMRENSHLGGIAYDGTNIWICHSGSATLERIPYEYIQTIAEDMPGCFINASAFSYEYRLENTPSCITCYGGRLWVATHTKLFDSHMLSYSYNAESDTLVAMSSYNIPSKVQGIAFDSAGSVYLSTSYGRNNSSYLKVYSSLLTLTRHPDAPAMKVEMPPCAEELAIVDGNIYIVFESASRKYFEGTDGNGTSASPLDKVLRVEIASIW